MVCYITPEGVYNMTRGSIYWSATAASQSRCRRRPGRQGLDSRAVRVRAGALAARRPTRGSCTACPLSLPPRRAREGLGRRLRRGRLG